jgi:hypothetical protein
MKRWIVSLTLVHVVGLCLNPASANTANLNTLSINTTAQVSEAELTKKFNSILDEELAGDNVCVTASAAHRLNALMTSSAEKIVRAKAFARVPEAEKNMRIFAKALLATTAGESGRTRITSETIDGVMNRRSSGPTEPPEATGGGTGLGDLLCPLFPIC